MKRFVVLILIAGVAGSVFWYLTSDGAHEQSYRLVTIERGNLEATVSSTGNLEAVTTVDVGTQVSGIISEILVDFNDYVNEGQLIARLDTTLLAIAAHEAEANLERSEADLKRAQREFKRISGLYEKGHVSEADFNEAEYSLEAAIAEQKASKLSLARARQNLSYASIWAPISGTVIARDVDVGQTVAASLSAPRLFVIAADLSRMQILASVDESDIGMIESGQEARFTVQAYPDDSFSGTVRQVRLQATTEENVVTYSVVIDVANDDRRLLPGMTATIDFVIETAHDVLMVANAALRFRPTESMMESMRAQFQGRGRNRPDSTGGPPQSGTDEPDDDMIMLWYPDGAGNVSMTPARIGISDGQSTVITGREIEEGMQVIAGIMTSSQTQASNPFSSQTSGRRPRPPGPGF